MTDKNKKKFKIIFADYQIDKSKNEGDVLGQWMKSVREKLGQEIIIWRNFMRSV